MHRLRAFFLCANSLNHNMQYWRSSNCGFQKDLLNRHVLWKWPQLMTDCLTGWPTDRIGSACNQCLQHCWCIVLLYCCGGMSMSVCEKTNTLIFLDLHLVHHFIDGTCIGSSTTVLVLLVLLALLLVLVQLFNCPIQSQSHITTDIQSASPSWCQAPIWDLRPIFLSPWNII
jgi:hypothetical protein